MASHYDFVLSNHLHNITVKQRFELSLRNKRQNESKFLLEPDLNVIAEEALEQTLKETERELRIFTEESHGTPDSRWHHNELV